VLRGIADGAVDPTPPVAPHPIDVHVLDALRTGMGTRSSSDRAAREPDSRRPR
jgi:hypothetical protein